METADEKAAQLARCGAIASFPLVSNVVRLSTDVDLGERGKKPKYIQEPQHYSDDDDRVHDRFYGCLHGDKTIHQPQENTYYDQGYYDLK